MILDTILSTIEVAASNVKSRHWTTYGSHFRATHLLFDDIWKTLLDGADNVAETIRILGDIPVHTMAAYLERSKVRETQTIDSWDIMVTETRNELQTIIAMIHGGVQDKAFDPTTENDLLSLTSLLRHHCLFLDGLIEQWGEKPPTNPATL